MRLLLLLLSCLGLTVPVVAQFTAILYTMEPFLNVCHYNCGDTLQDGEAAVFVYWDHNDNGRDASDPLAPDAVQNTYALNGGEYLQVPGAFYTDPAFTYSQYIPNPSKFYVLVHPTFSTIDFFSAVISINQGYSEFDLTGTWSCQGGGMPCDEPWEFSFTSDPWNSPLETCFDLCPFQNSLICFDNRTALERPLLTFLWGCEAMGECLSSCCPATFEFHEDEWAYDSTQATWCNRFYPSAGGCVCLVEQSPNSAPPSEVNIPMEYALLQNYPNPFNPSTNLVFDVVAENVVNLTVYNAMGQEVASLVNGTMVAGRHTVTFDATNLTSGLYFYTVKIGNEFTATKKMLLVK